MRAVSTHEWIRAPDRLECAILRRPHPSLPGLCIVVTAEQMQRAVDDEQRQFVVHIMTEFLRLGRTALH